MGRSRRSAAPARRPAAPARRPVSTQAAPPKATPPAPTPAPAPPAQQSSGGGMLSGIGSTIAQGFAFGAGSAVAHQAVGAAVNSMSGGGSSGEPAPAPVTEAAAAAPMGQVPSNDICSMDRTNFYDCLKHSQNDEASCNFLYDQLKACQTNQAQFQ